MHAPAPALAVLAVLASLGPVHPAGAAAPAPQYELVSATPQGDPGVNGSSDAAISADGRWVAFSSASPDLVAGGDGSPWFDVYLRDRSSQTTVDLTPRGNGQSRVVDISADGRRVLFASAATNLAQPRGDGERHLFLWRRGAGVVQVDLTVQGRQPSRKVRGASLSADGRWVAFATDARGLVGRSVTPGDHLYRHEVRTGRTTVLDPRGDGDATAPSVSGDGDRIAFTAAQDLLLWQRGKGVRHLARGADGGAYRPDLSRDGSTVAFETARSLVPEDDHVATDVYTVDVATGEPTWITRTDEPAEAFEAAVSDRGRWVVLTSYAHLVPDDTDQNADVYRYRRGSTTPDFVTGSQVDVPGSTEHGCSAPAVSGDGAAVAFTCYDPGLVEGDDNDRVDVLLADYSS